VVAGAFLPRLAAGGQGPMSKSFLLLFFKKEEVLLF
jgi:hypothetical protein